MKTARHPSIDASPVDETRVYGALGDAHLVNCYDGVVGRKFTCHRCSRKLPESRFSPLGPRFAKTRLLTALHPHCHTCRKQAKGRWTSHPLYSPELDRYWASRLRSLAQGAYQRNIFVGLEAEDLLGKYLDQDGICALTGLQMETSGEGRRTKSGNRYAAPSVDRIDSNKHYTPDNIQIVMAVVNVMKNDIPQQVFIELCHQISAKNLI